MQKAAFDQAPTGGEIRITIGQGPDRVQVIREDHGSFDREGMSCPHLAKRYPSGEGRLSSVGLMWRDCAVVQTPVFAPVQETVRWQASRFWSVLSGVAGGA